MTNARRTEVYKTVGDVSLRVHVFEPASPAAARPAIVFFHGGGWMGGTPSQFFPHCEYLASRGMLAMSAEYRVGKVHGTTPFECVKDGKSALRWARVHAAELRIDPERLAAGGGSAGGHVAACTATIPDLDEEGEDLSIRSCPDALALFNPVADTTSLGFGAQQIGASPERLSPAHHVTPGVAPTIIFHGEADTTVPIENVERFERLMREAGNACRLVRFPDRAHGFFNYGRDDRTPFYETVRAMDRFLARHGFLEGEPTLQPGWVAQSV